jgi:hypothetical protein
MSARQFLYRVSAVCCFSNNYAREPAKQKTFERLTKKEILFYKKYDEHRGALCPSFDFIYLLAG